MNLIRGKLTFCTVDLKFCYFGVLNLRILKENFSQFLSLISFIASVNIDHLTRTLDVEVLRENISSIAYCDIEEEVDTRIVDQNFLKVFKMSQLIIQYLVVSIHRVFSNVKVTFSFCGGQLDNA